MYFIFKTEPDEFSFTDLEEEGRTVWNGVKNPLAQKFIKSAQPGDKVFIYHTAKEKKIVGLAEVVTQPYIYTDGLYVVDIVPVRRFTKTLSLGEIKSIEEFKDHYIVKMPRLSVMPVEDRLASLILSLTDS